MRAKKVVFILSVKNLITRARSLKSSFAMAEQAESLFLGLQDGAENPEVTEIESMCMNCFQNVRFEALFTIRTRLDAD